MADVRTRLMDAMMNADRWTWDAIGFQRPPAQPYQAPAMDNPYTTPGDTQRERISGALGWDIGRPLDEFRLRAGSFIPLFQGPGVMATRGLPAVVPPYLDEMRRGRAVLDWWNRRGSGADPLASLAPTSNEVVNEPIQYASPWQGAK